jgi:hypothetical protein
MADDAFAFIQAVFHVVLFIVLHGHRARLVSKPTAGKERRKTDIPFCPPACASKQARPQRKN